MSQSTSMHIAQCKLYFKFGCFFFTSDAQSSVEFPESLLSYVYWEIKFIMSDLLN